MIDIHSSCKKNLDSYVKWIQGERFCQKKYEVTWIDIDLEMYTIFDEYKIERIDTKSVQKSNTYRYLLSLIPTTEQNLTEYLNYINEFLRELGSKQADLRNNLCSRYCIRYLNRSMYNYNIKSFGYIAVYHLNEKDWYKCNTEDDYFNTFKRCIRYDFKKLSDIEESIMNYKKIHDDMVNDFKVFLKSLTPTQPT